MTTMLKSLKEAHIHFLHWNLERIARCLDEITEEQVWQRPNASSNSIGNQVLHLCGNIRQWLVAGLSGEPDIRERDEEFAATGGVGKAELLARLTAVVKESEAVIAALTEEELLRERPVQTFVHDGMFILTHVTEHLSYHTGQIIFWVKALKDEDLDLYGGIELV